MKLSCLVKKNFSLKKKSNSDICHFFMSGITGDIGQNRGMFQNECFLITFKKTKNRVDYRLISGNF